MVRSRYSLYKKASKDLENIIDWYEQVAPGLSIQFLQEIEGALHQIVKSPSAYKPVTQGIRRCLLKKFPYIIYFIEEKDRIVVLRVRGKRQKTLKRYS